jgi:hypothetical protein
MQPMTVEELEDLVAEGSQATLEQLVDASVRVFGLLADAIQDPESKQSQHLLDLVNRLKVKLEDESKKALNEAGMSEEDLKEFLNNPENFSPQEWEQLQSMQSEMSKASSQFMQAALKESPEIIKKQEGEGAAKRLGGRRSDWLDA